MDYKEKLRLAKEALDSGSYDKETIEYIFPELAESEDESIRKAMINYFTNGKEYLSLTPYSREDYIAWLEKKGEQETLCDKCKKAQPSHSCQDITALGRCAVEHEQKSADKVEPKFKAGDWIVYNDNLYHIGNIALQRYYECLRVDGTVHTFGLDIDSKSHLWTINDAKKGDVLANKYGDVMLFKGITDDRHICGYYQYSAEDSKLYNECSDFSNYYPATQEQRDTLMKAMADAGYTFDFEKKELKKIEQKPVEFNKGDEITVNGQVGKVIEVEQNPTEWSDEDYVMQRAALEILMASPKTVASTILKESVIVWLQFLKDRMQSQRKQEWTEKDIAMSNFIALILKKHQSDEDFSTFETSFKNCIDWLKALKDRVHPSSCAEGKVTTIYNNRNKNQ